MLGVLVVFVPEAEGVAGPEALHPAEAVFGFFFEAVLCAPAFAGGVVFFALFCSSPGF